MQPVEKSRKESYVEPILEFVELEGADIVCLSGSVEIDPGFEGEIIIILN